MARGTSLPEKGRGVECQAESVSARLYLVWRGTATVWTDWLRLDKRGGRESRGTPEQSAPVQAFI